MRKHQRKVHGQDQPIKPPIANPLKRRAVKIYKKRVAPPLSPSEFKNLYHFEEKNVEWLANYFLGESTEHRGGAMSCKDQIKIFLRYASDNGSIKIQTVIADSVGCDQSTVSKILNRVQDKILEKSHLWISFQLKVKKSLQQIKHFKSHPALE